MHEFSHRNSTSFGLAALFPTWLDNLEKTLLTVFTGYLRH